MAMRYGTVPVVRATGGLKDTVIDHTAHPTTSTGFHFIKESPLDFDAAVEQAIEVYRQPRKWSAIRNRALKRNSSWETSAMDYIKLYQKILAS